MVLRQVGVSFFQHSYRKTDGQFNASYSTLCCQNLKLHAVHRCAQLFSYTTVGCSCTQLGHPRGSAFARDKKRLSTSQCCSVCPASTYSLAWERVSPSICSNDDIKLQLIDRVCPGVDPSSPTNFCKMFGVCNQTEMHEKSQQTASGRRFWGETCAGFLFVVPPDAHLLSVT